MRLFSVSVVVLAGVFVGSVVIAQTKIATPQDYTVVMKSNAQNMGGTNKAIMSGAYADAKTSLATVRQNFMALQAFWTEKKKDDAVAIVKDGLVKIEALDKLLSAGTVDQMAALAQAKMIQGACGACHGAYREGSAQEGFKFKEGVW
jgi:cytochrome c556